MSAKPIHAVLFDLDGVLVSTDHFHYLAWKSIADEQGIEFNEKINERLRGVSRMDSLNVILERASRAYSDEEKQALCARKNEQYVSLIATLTPANVLPGALETVLALRAMGIKTAVGSVSKNTPTILQKTGLDRVMDAVADGNCIVHSKPDPEVFLKAADMVGIAPCQCLVVEDADAGIEAAAAGGMRSLAVGSAQNHPLATLSAASLQAIDLQQYINLQNE